MPFYIPSVYNFPYQSLQYQIWCLVRTEELLSDRQKEMKSEKVRYDDTDWGKGVHPNKDKERVHKLEATVSKRLRRGR